MAKIIQDPKKATVKPPTNILGQPVGKATAVSPTSNTSYNPALGTAQQAAVSTGTATTYKPTTTNAASYNATTGTATTYAADQRNVQRNATVAGQLEDLLKKDSAYLKRAQVGTDQQMAARGLSNSSMAVGAREAALIDRALPIAQQDASTYDMRDRTNMDAVNQASQFNATSKQQMNLANMDALNQSKQFNAGNQQQVNLANMDARNQSEQFNAANKQNMTLANMDAKNQNAQFNAQQSNAMTESNMNAKNQASQFNIEAAQRERMETAKQAHEVALTRLEGGIKENLLNIEMQYKADIEGNSNASKAYMQSMESMSQVFSNTGLSADQQNRAVNEITTQLGHFLDFNRMLENPNYVPSYKPYQMPAATSQTPAPAAASKPAAPLPRDIQSYRDWVKAGYKRDVQAYRDWLKGGYK